MGFFSAGITTALALFCTFLFAGGVFAAPHELHGGWDSESPYQYKKTLPSGITALTGLDIEIMRALCKKAGFRVIFEKIPWTENLEKVREGRFDFGLAVTPEESRHQWAWFTVPYRKESIVAFKRKDADLNWGSGQPLDNLRHFLEGGGKVAVPRGFFFGPAVEALITAKAFEGQILGAGDYGEALGMVLSNRADLFLSDHLSGPCAAWQAGTLDRIEEMPGVLFETDLSIMLSKKSCTSTELAALNESLMSMLEEGEIDGIARQYLVPRLLLITLRDRWFKLLEIIGTVAFAISGVIIARRERYDVVGAVVLASLPALGGGIMRDLISGRSPVGIIETSYLFLMVLGTVFVGFLFFLARDLWGKTGRPPKSSSGDGSFRWASAQGILNISDAIGLSTFTVIGVMVAVEQHCEPLWLWGPVFAALTGAGGGILRDVLRAQADIPSLKGTLYPEIAILWGFVYSVAIISQGSILELSSIFWLTLGVLAGIVTTRVVVLHLGLRCPFLGATRY
jgi:polar amino acid transport system substrate-binding protein